MELAFASITPEHFQPPLRGKLRGKLRSQRPSQRTVKGDTSRTRKLLLKANKGFTKIYVKSRVPPLSPPFMEFIRRAFDRTLANTVYPKHSGYIRFLTPSPPDVVQYDKSLTEWFAQIEHFKKHTNAFPFMKDSVKRIEENFLKQQRIRMLIHKCVHRMIKRMIDARPHDMCDLYTTLPIPQGQCITVYDVIQKRKYTFHTHTAIKIIESALYYSSYGIARPLMPKNPYTNVPWTMPQMIAIVHQISYNLLRRHAFLPHDIHALRRAGYCAQRFYKENPKSLNVRAAQSFFAQTDDAYRNSIYREIVSDLHTDMNIRKGLIPYVMERSLPASLMRKWDDIVVASFMEQNLHVFTDEFRTVDAINTAFLEAHDLTYQYVSANRRKIRRNGEIVMRVGSINVGAGLYANVSLSANVLNIETDAAEAEAAADMEADVVDALVAALAVVEDEATSAVAPGGEPIEEAEAESVSEEVEASEEAEAESVSDDVSDDEEEEEETAAEAPEDTNTNLSVSLESVWGNLSGITPINLTEIFNQTGHQTINPDSVSMLFGLNNTVNTVAPIAVIPYSNVVVDHISLPSNTAVSNAGVSNAGVSNAVVSNAVVSNAAVSNAAVSNAAVPGYISLTTPLHSPVLRYSNIGTEISVISHASDYTIENMILHSINSIYENKSCDDSM